MVVLIIIDGHNSLVVATHIKCSNDLAKYAKPVVQVNYHRLKAVKDWNLHFCS